MKSGIYAIINKTNNKMYIGQSQNIFERWKQHKKDYLKFNKKSPLYADMKKIGIKNFQFKVLEYCYLHQLNTKEKYYIEKYNSQFPNGYNIQIGGGYYGPDSYIGKNSG